MKRKAQGLSLNTIIIAAIVLIVLIVLWAIFTGRMGGFAEQVKTTDSALKCTDDIVGGQVSIIKGAGADADKIVCPTGKRKIPGTFADADGTTAICCTK